MLQLFSMKRCTMLNIHPIVIIKMRGQTMRKFILLVILLITVTGCSSDVSSVDPDAVLQSVIAEKYSSGKILSTSRENNYYLSLVEDDNCVYLIILDNDSGQFEYLGGGELDKMDDDFAVYQLKNDQTQVIVFGLNNQFHYDTLSLSYSDIERESEQLLITDDISKQEYVLQMYNLTPEYNLDKASAITKAGAESIIY